MMAVGRGTAGNVKVISAFVVGFGASVGRSAYLEVDGVESEILTRPRMLRPGTVRFVSEEVFGEWTSCEARAVPPCFTLTGRELRYSEWRCNGDLLVQIGL